MNAITLDVHEGVESESLGSNVCVCVCVRSLFTALQVEKSYFQRLIFFMMLCLLVKLLEEGDVPFDHTGRVRFQDSFRDNALDQSCASAHI